MRMAITRWISPFWWPTGEGTYWGLNKLRPRQDGRHFPDDAFIRIFLNENVRISFKISLKFIPTGPINNIPTLFQIMALRRSGDKSLSEPMMVSLFVCFITKSFLTYSFFPPTPALSTISRPLSSSMCSITPETANVCSSYNRMRGPGIGCWFSDRSNCSHWSFEADVLPNNPNIYTDQWEPIVMYHSISNYYYWSLYNYAAHAAGILTPTTVVQGVDNHSWGLYCRRCYCIRACWRRSSRIFHFSRWFGQLSTVLTKGESPHTGDTFTPWVVSFTPPSIEH